ncbi:Carbohydrate binding module (family 6) [Actinacidiphila yanglinensis]|uniref:Carbohydrate binding module (Family 6) n=1 Tax=Actinacidiphila yanglinensis TaxID=310779 RepID=A0A1H6CSD2_9ACTN|nr:TIM-barrel domain-containing protein [Actinacidiphila yanglinensis]SEG75939.1 Carbohydrate binding module (family 6) [Actinacidiphila yanglinensis]
MTRRARTRTIRRRVAVVAAVAAAATVLTGTGQSALARGGAAHPHIPTVTEGNARFEVLSPTLIRTEYAGDGTFTDSATFNAIGRDSFTSTPYTSSTSGGWLTLKTSKVTLRYKLDSGAFTAQNLSVNLTAGSDPVTATPWNGLTCDVGALCEAEDLSAAGVSAASDHTGATGTGFLAGFTSAGDAVTADVNASSAGSYEFDARYANALGGDNQNTTRTLSLSVDGGTARTVSLPVTADWNTWSVARVPLDLTAGHHTVTLEHAAADSGNVNVDSIAVVTPGASYPGVSATAITDCAFGASCESEAGRASGSAKVATDHQGYSGAGFVAELNQGAGLAHRVVGVPADGTYLLRLRYANGVGGDGLHQTRSMTVTAGGATTTLNLPATTDWDTWGTASVPVKLTAGTDDISLGCPDATSCHVNADTVSVTASSASAPPPHLALGGYRRGLDGVNGDNGDPATTPGLLYRDGWYLLNDTSSALYSTATGTATARPGHGGAAYQDGYLFGYGHDYQQGLSDLATLTGPSELLPEWAYGVWYSEYMDRSAADYENTILPDFRSEGVPLDALVTDTDFKSPATWDGWEMDPAKFPDPKAFFDWAAGQGLHNTLNIHPSIVSNDPQFAQAEATAKNKLTKSGCSGSVCTYTFDFGDPDQLKAYMGLHQTMEQQGADFWWLDWCCDNSDSTLAGVTPDAWINQQYATDANKTVGRGFVLSRAYGSLQSGGYSSPTGVPTGPWADKRSTVHFTGDTSSTWGTLKFEVGYTPGESASTGLSAVSHDIGGFNDATGLTGSETYNDGGTQKSTTKLPDDLYARWVQLGTFQPVDRLHGNHSDRLPWQYGTAARTSADKFLNLREDLLPYTYTLSQQANTTGVPVVRPMYLQYPEENSAYTTADSEYMYGPDVLVAPVTTPGTTATTSVWLPPGTTWTDYFTGQTYPGGTTQTITTGLDSMPVFVKAGAIVPTRTDHVTNDVQNPLTKVTLTVAGGASGSFSLYEDDGTSAPSATHSSTTAIHYTEKKGQHTLTIGPASGSFHGQVASRQWTVTVRGVSEPTAVAATGTRLPRSAWKWSAADHSLTVTLPARSVHAPTTVTFH